MSDKRIDVAVAIVCREDGTVLWGCRPEGKPYAGYWEFPGGKVEPGETVWQALVRELQEELDIVALQGAPWFLIEHDYEHAKVRLHLYRVWRFSGEPKSLEQQAFCWAPLQPGALNPILPATEPLLPALDQPVYMAITDFSRQGRNYAHQLEQGLQRNVGAYVQFRERGLSEPQLIEVWEQSVRLCDRYKARLLINSACLNSLRALEEKGALQASLESVAAGVHLTEADLMAGFTSSKSGNLPLLGASVHGQEALKSAFEAKLSYAILGAVHTTASHPGQAPLGWSEFARLISQAKLPVYAVGGLSREDRMDAWQSGAHGVAMITGW